MEREPPHSAAARVAAPVVARLPWSSDHTNRSIFLCFQTNL
jgi:hypothetical protein